MNRLTRISTVSLMGLILNIGSHSVYAGVLCTSLGQEISAQTEAILQQTPSENRDRVQSTLISFGFLKQNSIVLAGLPEAGIAHLMSRIHTLFSDLGALEIPETPDTVGPDVSEDQIIFQKINRSLFRELDDKYLIEFRTTLGSETDFSFPVVEWAQNVLPELSFEFLISRPESSLEGKWVGFVSDHYNQGLLKKYLESGWDSVSREYGKISNDDQMKALTNKLRCSMCYPARSSLF